MAVEPPVPCMPKARFLYFSTSAGACSPRTWLQSASSSSATRTARPDIGPWPISMCLERTVTVSSGAMRTKALGMKSVPSAGAGSRVTASPAARPDVGR